MLVVISNWNTKLYAYKFKDEAQTYTQWKDNRDLRARPISWEVFRGEFLDSFFPRKKREEKVEAFIKLCLSMLLL